MSAAAHPELTPGRVYRTRDLMRWGANPTRLAQRLVRDGRLRQLAQGLFYAPEQSHFGAVPPDDREVLRGFLRTDTFVITGPPLWNSLGLGATAMFPATLAYNTKRSGEFKLGGRRFHLRRVRHPEHPPLEWFVIDLIENHGMAGVALSVLEEGLVRAFAARRFDVDELRREANEYGTYETRQLIERCIARREI